jgi:hypothetical protein
LKQWRQGLFLSARIEAQRSEPLFPWCMRLKGPGSRALGEEFAAVQQWIRQLQQLEQKVGCALQWRVVHHRQIGENRVPEAICFGQEEALLRMIGKLAEAERFQREASGLLERLPQLRDWVVRHPHKILQHHPQWGRLAAVVEWLQAHPQPGIYLRQIDLPGVDTKFIEQHRKILMELLDTVLPRQQIDTRYSGVKAFEARYGFRSKPALIRFRLLDPELGISGLTDLTLPVEAFAALDLAVETIFITENEINGLAFPPHPKSLVIFGLGYGLQLLQQVLWLRSRKIHYWGDIDTHGFAMLDQIRHYLPQTRSMLMDRQTLLQHRDFWGSEQSATRRALTRLNPQEQALYQELLDHSHAENLRLEQERITFAALLQVLETCRGW